MNWGYDERVGALPWCARCMCHMGGALRPLRGGLPARTARARPSPWRKHITGHALQRVTFPLGEEEMAEGGARFLQQLDVRALRRLAAQSGGTWISPAATTSSSSGGT